MGKKKRKCYKPANKIYYDTSHHKNQTKLGEYDDEETKEEA